MTLVISTDAPSVVGPPQGQWTYAEWETLPNDGNRYEIVDGVLYMTTAPSNFHQWIIKRLERYLGIPAEDQGLAYTFPAPIGLLMPGCDPVQPDYVVILSRNAGIIGQGKIRGTPDLIIEVQSPGNASYDEKVKLPAYAMAGVPEYAIVKPHDRTLDLYELDERHRYKYPRTFRKDELVAFGCLPTISFVLADLFAGAPDVTL